MIRLSPGPTCLTYQTVTDLVVSARLTPSRVTPEVASIANLAWAPLFFGLKKLKLAAGLQFALLGSLAAVWSAFKKDSRLLIPYAAWLSYARALLGL